LSVQAKYSCGFAVVVLQEPAKPFPTAYRCIMFRAAGKH
jgi:hypothetical protein